MNLTADTTRLEAGFERARRFLARQSGEAHRIFAEEHPAVMAKLERINAKRIPHAC